jgi:hypothetical protein
MLLSFRMAALLAIKGTQAFSCSHEGGEAPQSDIQNLYRPSDGITMSSSENILPSNFLRIK